MASGHGLRTSLPRGANMERSGSFTSDQPPDGSLYTASIAATEPFDDPVGFGLRGSDFDSFEPQQQPYSTTQFLDMEQEFDSAQKTGPLAALGSTQRLLQSQVMQQHEDLAALDGDEADFADAGSDELQDHAVRAPAAYTTQRLCPAAADSRNIHGSPDSMRMHAARNARQSSSPANTRDSPQQQQRQQWSSTQQIAADMPPRPYTASPSQRQPSRQGGRPVTTDVLQAMPVRQLVSRNSSAGKLSQQQGAVDDQQPRTRRQQRQQPEQQPGEQQQPQRNQRPPVVFEGDLSDWGRTDLESFYDEDDAHSLSSLPTMSSGVSPRQQRVKPFDPEAARETLAYTAGLYSRAQMLRRDGTAPAAMGVADDLPTRMAYQQLNILAGMAGKVQDAILHNKRIFEQRLLMEDRALMKKVFGAWRAVQFGSVAKQIKLKQATARIMRGTLSRAFFTWKDELHLVAATIARGLLKRTFLSWQHLAHERQWKNQLLMREREVALLEKKQMGYEKRPIQVLRNRRLRLMLAAWTQAAGHRQGKRLAVQRAGRFWVNQQLSKAWNAWVNLCETAARRRVLSAKVIARCQKIQLAAAWNSWTAVADAKRESSMKVARAAKQWQQALSARAWRSWWAAVEQWKARRQIAARWMQPAKASALAGWLDYVAWTKRNRLLVSRAVAKLQHGAQAAAFEAWLDVIRQGKVDATLKTNEGLVESVERMRAENERLRRDNERFVRLIDSGEWGRGRVAELMTAGEVMQAERDALLKLIGSLRREYEAVQMAKGAQEHELRQLKEKMNVGGPARNRLLVKGGSSFNALVRAMKQDLLESGTATKDPSLLYEIDKLSMDRVQVYPDGELAVQAVAAGPAGTAASAVSTTGSGSHPASRGSRATGSPQHRRPGSAAAAAAAFEGPTSPAQMARGRVGASIGSNGSTANSKEASRDHRVLGSSGPAAAMSHTVMNVTPGRGEAGGSHPYTAPPGTTQQVLQVLSSLTAAQVDQLSIGKPQQLRTIPAAAATAAAGQLGGAGAAQVSGSLLRGSPGGIGGARRSRLDAVAE